jgi:hypothetical protein
VRYSVFEALPSNLRELTRAAYEPWANGGCPWVNGVRACLPLSKVLFMLNLGFMEGLRFEVKVSTWTCVISDPRPLWL